MSESLDFITAKRENDGAKNLDLLVELIRLNDCFRLIKNTVEMITVYFVDIHFYADFRLIIKGNCASGSIWMHLGLEHHQLLSLEPLQSRANVNVQIEQWIFPIAVGRIH